MSRDVISVTIDDVSDFAKRLRSSLAAAPALPGHAAFLGMIAKAAGFQNYQHLRADAPAAAKAVAANPARPPVTRALERALRVFDDRGIMKSWPKNYSTQNLALWVFWSDLPPKEDLTEPQVNDVLKAGADFGDHVLLRRSLIDHRLAHRTLDGRIYRRIEAAPPQDALQMIRTIRERRAAQ